MTKYILLVLLVAGLAGGGYYYFVGADETGPRILETVEVELGNVRKELEATGIVKSQVGGIVKIGAQATGKIMDMKVKVGDRVEEGDLIALIDDREIEAARIEAEARLERAGADLAQVQSVFPLQISEAQSNVRSAQAEFDYQQTLLERRAPLVETGVISRDEYDETEQLARVRENVLRARKATLSRLRTEFDKELKKARKAVVEAEASLNTVQTRKSYTRIISPLTGVVSQVTAQEGETVVSGLQVSNLITILDPTRLEMWIYIDETDVGQVLPGMPVEFSVDAYPDDVFTGSINQVYPQPEIRDNIVYYQTLVPLSVQQAEKLRPEMTTQCRIIVEEKKDVVALPNRALKWVAGEQLVFKQTADGGVESVKPKLGLSGLTHSEVLQGVEVGEKVAVQVTLPGDMTAKAQAGGGQGRGGGRR